MAFSFKAIFVVEILYLGLLVNYTPPCCSPSLAMLGIRYSTSVQSERN